MTHSWVTKQEQYHGAKDWVRRTKVMKVQTGLGTNARSVPSSPWPCPESRH